MWDLPGPGLKPVFPAVRGPPLRIRMPLGCQGPTGGVVPSHCALAPWTRGGSPGADGKEPRERPAPGALWPGRPLPREAPGLFYLFYLSEIRLPELILQLSLLHTFPYLYCFLEELVSYLPILLH